MTNIQEVISAFMVMHASGAPCFWPLEQHNMVVCRLLVAGSAASAAAAAATSAAADSNH